MHLNQDVPQEDDHNLRSTIMLLAPGLFEGLCLWRWQAWVRCRTKVLGQVGAIRICALIGFIDIISISPDLISSLGLILRV